GSQMASPRRRTEGDSMTQSMSMVEKVARAIATSDWRLEIDEFKEPKRYSEAEDAYDLTNNNGRYRYDELACAAIEAMLVPSDEMVSAGVRADLGGTLGSRVRNAYRDMIEVALN